MFLRAQWAKEVLERKEVQRNAMYRVANDERSGTENAAQGLITTRESSRTYGRPLTA